jgi:hypothetical protein
VMVLGLVFCLLCWRVSRSIMPPSQAALATALFLVSDYGKLSNATHHWFSVLAVMGSVSVLLKGSSLARTALAGAFLGLSSFFTQTRGPVAALGIAVWLLLERSRTGESWTGHLKRQTLLFASLAATWLVLSGYYIATVGLQRLWYFQVTYVRRYMVSGWNALPSGSLQGLLGQSPSGDQVPDTDLCVNNNPLTYTDPSGFDDEPYDSGDGSSGDGSGGDAGIGGAVGSGRPPESVCGDDCTVHVCGNCSDIPSTPPPSLPNPSSNPGPGTGRGGATAQGKPQGNQLAEVTVTASRRPTWNPNILPERKLPGSGDAGSFQNQSLHQPHWS